jgi:universal stress protein E
MTRSILVIIDPTAKEHPALARAHWYAGLTGDSVELFVCDYDQYLAGERFFDSKSLKKARADLLERRRGFLDKLAKPLRDDGIDVSVDVRWDHPLHDGLVSKIKDASPDTVFKDTHYHTALRRSIFSNTDWHLIRDCTSPLWLVKPHDNVAIGKIGVAVDPTHERDKPANLDRKLLATATGIAKTAGASVAVLHAFDPAPVYAVSADAMSVPIAEPLGEFVNELRQQHHDAVTALLKATGHADLEAHVADGDIREVLTGLLTDIGADLVVMGAVSRSGLKRLALGSTAERVLDFLPCDVLVVKPD